MVSPFIIRQIIVMLLLELFEKMSKLYLPDIQMIFYFAHNGKVQAFINVLFNFYFTKYRIMVKTLII